MFVLESLHPDGWRQQGTYKLEYWAYQEAQARCCSDGRNYRILHGPTQRLVTLVSSSCCKPSHRKTEQAPSIARP